MLKMDQHMHEKKICFLPQLLLCHCFTQFFGSLSPDMEHLLFLWSVKFIHLCLPKLCLTSYWQVSVLCLQHTGVYIRSGLFCFWFQERHCSWDQYGGSVDYVSCILLYSFRMVGLWMCCCKYMYFIGALCVVSSCWDSISTSLAKSSCSPPWLDWQPS